MNVATNSNNKPFFSILSNNLSPQKKTYCQTNFFSVSLYTLSYKKIQKIYCIYKKKEVTSLEISRKNFKTIKLPFGMSLMINKDFEERNI